jgi:hypothetical protein
MKRSLSNGGYLLRICIEGLRKTCKPHSELVFVGLKLEPERCPAHLQCRAWGVRYFLHVVRV